MEPDSHVCSCPAGTALLNEDSQECTNSDPVACSCTYGIPNPAVESCTEARPSNCRACLNGFVLNEESGACACPSFEYTLDPELMQCVPPSPTDPIDACSCEYGLPDASIDLASCTRGAPGNCLRCLAGFVLNEETGVCECPEHHELDVDTLECIALEVVRVDHSTGDIVMVSEDIDSAANLNGTIVDANDGGVINLRPSEDGGEDESSDTTLVDNIIFAGAVFCLLALLLVVLGYLGFLYTTTVDRGPAPRMFLVK